MAKTKAISKATFEENLSDLEHIVQTLERGELGLEESMKLFQRGMELSKVCNEKLIDAEKKITILLENDQGELIEKDFLDKEEL